MSHHYSRVTRVRSQRLQYSCLFCSDCRIVGKCIWWIGWCHKKCPFSTLSFEEAPKKILRSFPSHVIWWDWGATAESIMTSWKMRMMRRFFTTLNLKVCGLFVLPLTPFTSETEYKRFISYKNVSLIWFFNVCFCFQWKKRLFVIGWASESFLLAVKNHVPWVSLLFSVTIRDCRWGIKTFPGDFVLVSYNIGDGKDTEFGGLIIKGLVQNKLGFCSYTQVD